MKLLTLAETARALVGAKRLHTKPSFEVFRDVPSLRDRRRQLQKSMRTVGLVPTMGALHEGHLSLIRRAAAENSDVFVSIYVNPTQFGVNEDLASYPRTWESDLEKLEKLNAELKSKTVSEGDDGASATGCIAGIFAPTGKVMYPTLPPTSEIDGSGSFVTITPLATKLEGASRPVFFRGVTTVCTKLFNIVKPDRVYFGQKDVQQCVIIQRMVQDFHIDTEVRIEPTIREADGLAMSSRNVYLGQRRRAIGLVLLRALRAAEAAFHQGKSERRDILGAANKVAQSILEEQRNLERSQRALFEVDYISLADPETLEEVECIGGKGRAILSGAVKMLPIEEAQPGENLGLGDDKIAVRLIDNIILSPK